jgi:hypothetical protein
MMKFLAHLQPGKIDILNDRIDTDPNRLYLLDHKKLEKKYDFIIASAHDPNAFSYKKENKLIVVISHIPDMKSDAWPGFYVNLCMCDAIACDSFVRAELSKMTYPDKRGISTRWLHTTAYCSTNTEYDTEDQHRVFGYEVRFLGEVFTLHSTK